MLKIFIVLQKNLRAKQLKLNFIVIYFITIVNRESYVFVTSGSFKLDKIDDYNL